MNVAAGRGVVVNVRCVCVRRVAMGVVRRSVEGEGASVGRMNWLRNLRCILVDVEYMGYYVVEVSEWWRWN